jgi:Na+/melibiose symporter-like transporter
MNTYSNIPYDALGPELTDNYEDRSRLFFISGLFDGFGTILTVTTPVGLQLMLEWNTIFSAPNCQNVGINLLNETVQPLQMLNTAECSYKNMYEPVGGVQSWPSNIAAYNQSLYIPSVCKLEDGSELDVRFQEYCTCRDACKQAFSFGHERTAFTMVGAGFAGWYILTSIICVCCIKERSQIDGGASLHEPPPLVPSMLNTFNNKPFVMLLPAWACDAVTTGIIASMVSYFVRYVVKPEFQPGCADGLSDDWWCRSVPVTGLSVTMTLCAAFIFTPVWLFIAKKLGKRKTWLIWSMTMAVTNAFYILVGEGDHWKCIVISGINGIPFGAKFLADAILADIIDYDEFLTGQRSEATYTMFKSFLPKICAIPAAAIPLALLNVFGHVPPVNGRIQLQPPAIAIYCQVVTVVIPTLASLVATYFKWKFPLKTKEQCDQISSGVGKHMLGQAAPEPITGVKYKLETFKEDELQGAYLLDSFRGTQIIEDLLENKEEATKKNYSKAICNVVVALSSILLSIISTYITTSMNICSGGPETCFRMLEEPKYSFFPVLSIIWFGTSLTGVAFSLLKLKSSITLKKKVPERVVLLKVLSQRKVIAQVHQAMREGINVAGKIFIDDLFFLLTSEAILFYCSYTDSSSFFFFCNDI